MLISAVVEFWGVGGGGGKGLEGRRVYPCHLVRLVLTVFGSEGRGHQSLQHNGFYGV